MTRRGLNQIAQQTEPTNHIRTNTILAAALIGALAFVSTAAQAADPRKPNIVFILADNVGYGDLGPYGGCELWGGP